MMRSLSWSPSGHGANRRKQQQLLTDSSVLKPLKSRVGMGMGVGVTTNVQQ